MKLFLYIVSAIMMTSLIIFYCQEHPDNLTATTIPMQSDSCVEYSIECYSEPYKHYLVKRGCLWLNYIDGLDIGRSTDTVHWRAYATQFKTLEGAKALIILDKFNLAFNEALNNARPDSIIIIPNNEILKNNTLKPSDIISGPNI